MFERIILPAAVALHRAATAVRITATAHDTARRHSIVSAAEQRHREASRAVLAAHALERQCREEADKVSAWRWVAVQNNSHTIARLRSTIL